MVSSPKKQVFLIGFFLVFSASLFTYVASSFLKTIIREDLLGLIYSASAVGSLLLISFTPRLARRFGLLRPSRYLGLIVILGYLGLTTINLPAVQLALFIITEASVITLGLWLDIYLEGLTVNSETGRVRGGYLTVLNAAILIAPLISGLTLNHFGSFHAIFLLSLTVSIPFGYFLFRRLENRLIPKMNLPLNRELRNPDLRRILCLDLLFDLFYFVMVVYLPLHLHLTVGLSWPKIGVIFTIMLIPFVLTDYLLGYLADSRYGEKELLILGLLIAGLATLPIAWITTTNWLIWAALLFATRVGASAWEAMKEIYLFKKVDMGEVSVITLSRSMIPVSFLIGSLASVILLTFLPVAQLFTVLGLVVLSGIIIAYQLVDTT